MEEGADECELNGGEDMEVGNSSIGDGGIAIEVRMQERVQNIEG